MISEYLVKFKLSKFRLAGYTMELEEFFEFELLKAPPFLYHAQMSHRILRLYVSFLG